MMTKYNRIETETEREREREWGREVAFLPLVAILHIIYIFIAPKTNAMKYLLSFAFSLLLTTIIHAQTTKVENCVIENGVMKNVTTDYDPATGNYSIKVNGVSKPF